MTNRTGTPTAKSGPLYDPDVPIAGHYKTRLVKGGPPVALKLWFGLPRDPVTGDQMDRAPKWFATVNGMEIVDAFQFWPGCAVAPISFEEYRHIVRRSATLDPDDPYFDPRRPVDRSTARPPF